MSTLEQQLRQILKQHREISKKGIRLLRERNKEINERLPKSTLRAFVKQRNVMRLQEKSIERYRAHSEKQRFLLIDVYFNVFYSQRLKANSKKFLEEMAAIQKSGETIRKAGRKQATLRP